jgi:hypothetical protein
MAKRRGLEIKKSGRRDPHAIDYGRYAIVDPKFNIAVAGIAYGRHSFTLDDVEQWLTWYHVLAPLSEVFTEIERLDVAQIAAEAQQLDPEERARLLEEAVEVGSKLDQIKSALL